MFKFLKKLKKNRKGYTLTELIVVVAILGVLAAVGTPMVMGQIQKSKDNADLTSAKAIETAVQLCLADGTLKIASDLIADGTSVTTDTIAIIVKDKMSGKEYPTCNATNAKTWYLNLATGKVTTAAPATNPQTLT